jgi:hypothetical protein
MVKFIDLRRNMPNFRTEIEIYNSECPGMFWEARAKWNQRVTDQDDQCYSKLIDEQVPNEAACKICWNREVDERYVCTIREGKQSSDNDLAKEPG